MSLTLEYSIVSAFILDDPIAGVLDNVTYTLAGEKFVDISADLVRASISRGKNRELDRFSAGSGSFEMRNDSRQFDPNYTPGSLYGNLVPMRPIKLSVDGTRVFTGIVDDFQYAYTPKPESRAALEVSDEMTLLARQTMVNYAPASELSGSRVTDVLDLPEVLWPTERRNISTGLSTLGTATFSGNALEYLQKVDASEQGALFIAKNGDLTFLDRNDNAPRTGSITNFADDGSGIPFTRLAVNYGTEQLYNDVEITSPVGTATASNSRSQQTYGIISYSNDTLLSTTDQLQYFADYVVSQYADPEYRVSGLSVNMDSVTSGQRASILALELGSMCQIKFTPNGLGDPILQYAQVIGITHDIDQTRHDVTFAFASTEFTTLVLDDAVFGTIDNNAIGF